MHFKSPHLFIHFISFIHAGGSTDVRLAAAEGGSGTKPDEASFSCRGMRRRRRPAVAHGRDATARLQRSVVEAVQPLQQRIHAPAGSGDRTVIQAASSQPRPAQST